MNRKLISGALAGLAAIALATVGSTWSAPVESVEVAPNSVGIGVLRLDLSGGGSHAALSFADLMPGATSRRLLWLANDVGSSVAGTLAVTFRHLSDTAAPCDTSLDKARGEIASGIGGCTVAGETASGRPRQGNLSRLVDVDVAYDPTVHDAARCADAGAGTSVLPDSGAGNLRASATGAGRTFQLGAGSTGDALALNPGHGLCLAVTAHWPGRGTPASDATPEHPVDNAAQGDTFSVDVRFDLTQVHS